MKVRSLLDSPPEQNPLMRRLNSRRHCLAWMGIASALPLLAWAQGMPTDHVFVVRNSSPIASLDALTATARNAPDTLHYATATPAAAQQAADWLTLAGVRMVNARYRSLQPAVADLLDGHLHVMVVSASEAQALAGQGTLRTLGGLSSSTSASSFSASPVPAQPVTGSTR